MSAPSITEDSMKIYEPSVVISILNWNGLKDILDCLSSIKKINYKNYKVIILDNGSKDNEAKTISEKFSEFEVVRSNENLGFTEGNNLVKKIKQK